MAATKHVRRQNLRLAILSLLLCCVAALTGCTGGDSALPVSRGWQSLAALYSGQINVLVMTPLARDAILYAGSEGGVYKSVDEGAHWIPCVAGLSDRLVRALVLDPDRPHILYAGTRGGRVYKSSDSGDHWRDIAQGLNGEEIVALAVDRSDPEILYTATRRRVYVSPDGGQNWRLSSLVPTSDITSMSLDPSIPYLVYVGTHDGLLYSSSNRAVTWFLPVQVAPGLERVIPVPGLDGWLFAIANGQVFRSQDRGQNWSYNDNYLDRAKACCVVADPQDPRHIFVGTTRGVYRSTDGRSTWSTSGEGLPEQPVNALAFHPTRRDTLYTAIGRALYRSTNQGSSWQRVGEISEGLQANILAFEADPRNPDILYASAGGGGLYRSADAGRNWLLLAGLPSSWVTTMDLVPRDPDLLYAGTLEGKAYRSTNGGLTWEISGPGLNNIAIRSLVVDPEHPMEVYVGTWGDGLYLTRQWNQPWEKIETPFSEIRKLVLDARLWRRRIYALAPDTVWEFAYDAEGRLTLRRYAGAVSDLVLSPAEEEGVVLVASETGAVELESVNADLVVINQTLLGTPGAVRLLTQSPLAPQTVYAATENGRLWGSTDLGRTWVEVGGGLEGRRIQTLYIHPLTQALYVGTDQGLYRLP